MGYATYEFYTNVFHGSEIAPDDFPRLMDDASVLLNSIVQRPISADDALSEEIQRAACYQAELLAVAGGVNGLNDMAVNGVITSETLDDHSVTRSQPQGSAYSPNISFQHTSGGMPISNMAIVILRQLGYMSRWVYAGRKCKNAD